MVGYIRVSEIPLLIIAVVIGMILIGVSVPLWGLIMRLPDPIGAVVFGAMIIAIIVVSYLLAARIWEHVEDRL
jgi:hypothetical protein